MVERQVWIGFFVLMTMISGCGSSGRMSTVSPQNDVSLDLPEVDFNPSEVDLGFELDSGEEDAVGPESNPNPVEFPSQGTVERTIGDLEILERLRHVLLYLFFRDVRPASFTRVIAKQFHSTGSSVAQCPTGTQLINWGLEQANNADTGSGWSYCRCQQAENGVRVSFNIPVSSNNPNLGCVCFAQCLRA